MTPKIRAKINQGSPNSLAKMQFRLNVTFPTKFISNFVFLKRAPTLSTEVFGPSPTGTLWEVCWRRTLHSLHYCLRIGQQTRVYSYPLGAGSARPNPKMGAPDPQNPLFIGFSVFRGGLRPWSRKGPDHGVGVDLETVNRLTCMFVGAH